MHSCISPTEAPRRALRRDFSGARLARSVEEFTDYDSVVVFLRIPRLRSRRVFAAERAMISVIKFSVPARSVCARSHGQASSDLSPPSPGVTVDDGIG